jgi:hypothetical protein
MSATLTPGVSHGPVMGSFATTNPVAVAAGGLIPKGLWLATGTGVNGATAVFNFTPPGGGSAVACALVASDGVSVTSVDAVTLYRYIAG